MHRESISLPYFSISVFIYAVNSLFMLFASTLLVDGMNSSCE